MRFKTSLAAAAAAFLATAASAAPVQVGISAASFNPASGYGVDISEASGATLLDVRFSTAGFASQNFTLATLNATQSFKIGTVQLAEPNGNGGITAAETDNLGVTATLTFFDPVGSAFQVSAIGTATTGSVSDAFVDLVINWSPVEVAFGDGGKLLLAFQNLSFTSASTLDQMVSVTYTAEPRVSAVPEPASLALLGLGLSGLAIARRRRA